MNLLRICINLNYILKNIWSVLFLKREKKIADILLKNALTLSIAESCTGGLLSSRMTDLSGSSAYISQNFVTYANTAKIKLLDVNSDTIKKYGVVSEEVALEMAMGLLNKYNCSIAISTTGIAGPLGATDTKPVGLICIAVANKEFHTTYKFKANPLLFRRILKYEFSNKALDILFDFLNENY